MQYYAQPSPCAFPAMVSPVAQTISGLYPITTALKNGTLFPELNKPMNGVCASDSHTVCPGQAMNFAAWEVRLYLDTHPDDQRALALYRDLCQQTGGAGYACAFVQCAQNGWQWVNDPWPWELAANEGRA